MDIFKRTFETRNRTNKTSVARWHRPRDDSMFAQPSWSAIDQGDPEAHAVSPPTFDEDSQEHPFDVDQASSSQPEISPFGFDEQDLAVFAAKTARLGFIDGIKAGQQSDAAAVVGMLDKIQVEIASFSASVELPIGAIRKEMTDLLKAIVERICEGESADRKRALVETVVAECMDEFKSVKPLTISLNPTDRESVDEILTKLEDNPGPAEVEFATASDLAPGQVVVSWPGGGMERIVGGRDAALAALQSILDAQHGIEPEISIEEGTPD